MADDKVEHRCYCLVQAFTDRAMDAANDALEQVTSLAGSPIETQMALAIMEVAALSGSMVSLGYHDSAAIEDLRIGVAKADMLSHGDWLEQFEVWQQVVIGRYRADIVLSRRAYDPVSHEFKVSLLVVECDGHEFHEKTKEQARKDKARDRHFTGLGLQLFRFAGSEIHADAVGCAYQCLGHMNPHIVRPPRQ